MEEAGTNTAEKKSGPGLREKVAFYCIFSFVSFALLVLALKAVDQYFLNKRGCTGDNCFVIGATEDEPWVISYELYPYTGHHAQANYHVTGMPPYWNYYSNYDFRTGDCGFTIDFPLNQPPAKAKNEFRIIMIGGSAAWGEGARSNEDMHWFQLQKILNESDLAKESGASFRVIDMAMSGSFTYQNFIALNRWAHPLQPDLILSFSGRNDLFVPFTMEDTSDMPHKFENVLGVAAAAKHFNSPPWLKGLAHFFPGLLTQTWLGAAIRMLRLNEYTAQAKKEYLRRTGKINPLALYFHALSSIKRDFNGIPIMLVSQPIAGPAEMVPLYRSFVEAAFSAIAKNNDPKGWILFDFYGQVLNDPEIAKNVNRYFADPVHLSNVGQRYAAESMARVLVPRLREMLSSRSKK